MKNLMFLLLPVMLMAAAGDEEKTGAGAKDSSASEKKAAADKAAADKAAADKAAADKAKKAKKSGTKKVEILLPVAGRFKLPYNVGQEVELPKNQADEIIKAKYGKEVK